MDVTTLSYVLIVPSTRRTGIRVFTFLFAVRDSFQESLGFNPFELISDRQVREPLTVLKEHWLGDDGGDVSPQSFLTFRERLTHMKYLASENLHTSQTKMKRLFDRKAVSRTLED